MVKSPKKRRPLATFTVPMKVDVHRPDFEPFRSLASLDLKRLSKGNHKIEIGVVKGGCCPHLVRAVVRNGMVTGCETEPCKEHSAKPPRELIALMQKARREIRARGTWKPIPVGQFVRNSRAVADLIETGSHCIEVCWGFSCIYCCWPPDSPLPYCSFGPPIILTL